MSSFNLVAAAYSSAAGTHVGFDDDGDSAILLHEATTYGGPVGMSDTYSENSASSVYSTSQGRNVRGARSRSSQQSATSHVRGTQTHSFPIILKMLNGNEINAQVRSSDTVYTVKMIIQGKEGIPPHEVHLSFAGRPLDDHRTLAEYNIRTGSCLYVILKMRGRSLNQMLAKESLAPEFDYDFTNERGNGMTYLRGGDVYRRPYGWKRHALRVKGKYGNDVWLGENGIRTWSSEGEWPVSYHGTGTYSGKAIAEAGYDLTRDQSFLFDHGFYTTPDLSIAERYATSFEHDGKTYIMILQNRVNPLTLKKVNGIETGSGEFWINPNQEDVRPYGVLIKEVSRY